MVTESAKLIGAGGAAVGSAIVLATVRDGAVEAGDAVVLVAALAALTRVAIRAASDAGARGRRHP
jgi:hypothetical protein